MLSMYDSEQFLFESLRAGASGYVLKSSADRDIVDACRTAMRGASFLYPSAITALAREIAERSPAEGSVDVLTPRELQILKLIAEALSSKEIAQALSISVKTVDRHRANIFKKLEMHDRVELHPLRGPPRPDPSLKSPGPRRPAPSGLAVGYMLDPISVAQLHS